MNKNSNQNEKVFQITKEQEAKFPTELTKELEKVTMSWNSELKIWYPVAIEALDFATAPSLGIRQEMFVRLFDQEVAGLNMNVVMHLVNNMEMRHAREMNMTGKEWAEYLLKNGRIAARWYALSDPFRKKILERYEEENRANKMKAKLMGKGPAIMKPIIGEA